MRTYIRHHNSRILLDNVGEFSHYAGDGDTSGIRLQRLGENGFRTLVEGLEGSAAEGHLEHLLKLTRDGGEGTAVISWNGQQFVRHVL